MGYRGLGPASGCKNMKYETKGSSHLFKYFIKKNAKKLRRFVLRRKSIQELYFVKKYEIFFTEISARKKTKTEKCWATSKGIVSPVISSVGRPFCICSPVGEFTNRNVPCGSLLIIQFIVLSSTCEVS